MAKAGLWLLAMSLLGMLGCAAGQLGTSFQFLQFSQNRSSLSLLGDAAVAQDDLALELTRNATGRGMYHSPILFKDPATQAVISFTTSFIFSIEAAGGGSGNVGEGLAFIIVPDNTTLGSGGAWMGVMAAGPAANDTPAGVLSTAAPNPDARTVAVEFDVQKDIEFWDIDDNHVGVDVNTLNSVFAREAASGGVRVGLLAGHIKVWIEYDGAGRKMQVSLTPYAANNDYPKPADPLLALDLDLSGVVNEYMYVGFAAATRSGTVQHKVWSWTFESSTGGGPAGLGFDEFAPTPAPSDDPSHPADGAAGGTRPLAHSFYFCLAAAALALLAW